MSKAQDLYEFLQNNASEITQEWLDGRHKGTKSIYASDAGEETEKQLRENNQKLLDAMSKVFISEKSSPEQELKEWAEEVSERRVSEQVPIHETLGEFRRFRSMLWDKIKQFIYNDEVDLDTILRWGELLNDAHDYVVLQFVEHYDKTNTTQMHAQQQLINELSAPVIPITDKEAILPLIGDLDSTRTSHIQKSTLEQCSKHPYETLYLDMSGVQTIDTIVAHHIFQLIQSLDLLGVKSVICGMNPKVAQVAIQLGIDFSNITIKSTLSHALDAINFHEGENTDLTT
ncbi:STAS domain-containing protein [Pontibacillus yanchengensis]|uniref:STAS domain-containing protein n=2 Tax=Pontibacillus yanchengensis TaxID=462910 RepID=A0ACC7VIK4_9BACI|nr:STAS domain-containing protein [Pontibacillus yanchengensis]MYL34835.1 STAS domain-containing protein [Pontibacillus yanchengensis]MYL54791.1 STAS domain-containing protein [Pontibacillus yanchengensis]